MPNPKALSLSDALAAVTAPTPAPEEKPADSTSLALSLASTLVPHIAGLLENAATSKAVPQMAAKAGRVLGGITSLPSGLSGFGDVQRGVYAGGRAGYFTGKLGQNILADTLDAAPAAATALGKLSGAQGLLDIAQMAEPTRSDIGVLGVGKTVNVDPNDVRVKAQLEMNRANALKWAADHPSPSVQGLKNAFADMIAALKSHVEGTK